MPTFCSQETNDFHLLVFTCPCSLWPHPIWSWDQQHVPQGWGPPLRWGTKGITAFPIRSVGKLMAVSQVAFTKRTVWYGRRQLANGTCISLGVDLTALGKPLDDYSSDHPLLHHDLSEEAGPEHPANPSPIPLRNCMRNQPVLSLAATCGSNLLYYLRELVQPPCTLGLICNVFQK